MPQALATLLKPELQRIFEQISLCFNTRIVFYSASGELVTACHNRPDSAYCRLLRERLFGEETCRALDRTQCLQAAQQQRLLCYHCHAGLLEATKPISYCGRILGFVAIGQLRTEAFMPDAVRAAWEARRFPGEELHAAYAALPQVTHEHIEALLALFSMLVDYIVVQQMVVLAPQRDVQVILNYLEQHVADNPTLAEVARLVQKRPSTISHLFAQHLGQSFKHTLLEIKLRHAEDYMRRHPEQTVTAAALATGFSDPLYFSRLYKRYRQLPPSQFLTACREESQGEFCGTVTLARERDAWNCPTCPLDA